MNIRHSTCFLAALLSGGCATIDGSNSSGQAVQSPSAAVTAKHTLFTQLDSLTPGSTTRASIDEGAVITELKVTNNYQAASGKDCIAVTEQVSGKHHVLCKAEDGTVNHISLDSR